MAEATPTLTRTDSESVWDFLSRMLDVGTAEAISAGEAEVLSDDNTSALHQFEDRVRRSYNAGRMAIGRTLFLTGAAPKDYKTVAAAIEVSTDGGEYLGRKYSTMRECYRIAVGHSAEALAEFMAAYRVANGGRNAEQIRQYVKWLGNLGTAKAVENTPEAIRAAKVAEAEAAVRTAEAAAIKRAKAIKLADAASIDGVPLTPAQWRGFSIEVLADIELMAGALRRAAEADKAEATAKAKREAKASEAAAETGTTTTTAKRTRKVAA